MPDLHGFHHITAITGDAPKNVDFYCRVMGMRMVKKTVNFDAPEVYHLYYADETGTPGSILTFFEFPGARRGQAGAGMVHRIGWTVAGEASLDFWAARLRGVGDRG
jgi:glyoxalase family protein